jgi:ABC-2 type transport system ATP-binding protein
MGGDGVVCRGLTKYFGPKQVLDDVTFTAPMGKVTGFVGVNGAGKTTTLRIVLGLVAPTEGEALVAGRRYARLIAPRHVVGAVLEGPGGHPGQSGRASLEVLAKAAGIGMRRVTEMLELVGLADDAHRRVGGYSLGMRQRLALAAAMLGDPPILILDEPANGLDPLGIRWTRGLLRELAGEGRCVLVSSHQLSELEATAHRFVMIHKGRLIADTGVDDSPVARGHQVAARTREPARLVKLATEAGGTVTTSGEQDVVIRGLSAEEVGELAMTAGIVLLSLVETGSGLEEMFLELTGAGQARTTPDGASRGAE